MNFLKNLVILLASLIMAAQNRAEGKCLGKVELAPAYIHIDVIESKNTIKDLDMAGIRADLSYVWDNGWFIRPTAIYGKESEGEITNVSIGFGRCLPLNKQWTLAPSFGTTYTNMGASIHFDWTPYGVIDLHERFQAIAPFVGLELIYSFSPSWRLCASVQYAWSHSKTKVKELFTEKSDAEGPNYGLVIEHDLNQYWSVNLGGAYNESYSKEKNGLRARGLKLGLVRWF